MHEEIEVIDSFSKLPRFMLVTGDGAEAGAQDCSTLDPGHHRTHGWTMCLSEGRSLGLRKHPGELLGSQLFLEEEEPCINTHPFKISWKQSNFTCCVLSLGMKGLRRISLSQKSFYR